MDQSNIAELVAAQRRVFLSGRTKSVEWRKEQLRNLQALLEDHRQEWYAALRQDMKGRADFESELYDVGFCAHEAAFTLKHLDDWIQPDHVHTPVLFEPGHVRVRHDPLGVTLIIGAWNEPLMLTFGPLAPAIAAGNTAVVKPSELLPTVSALTARLVAEYLDPEAITVVEGGVAETTELLEQKWDMIFFTGSSRVGKIVHQAAAKQLTPCVLELGGKNPTIVHSSADIRTAARRIAFSRFTNGGQVCTAPDHVLVWPEVKDELVAELVDAVRDFYGEDPQRSNDYMRVINTAAFDRLAGLLDSGTAAIGGQTDRDDLYIAPTVLTDVSWDSPVMQEEVFGPILPVLEVDSVETVVSRVNSKPQPLALYVFTQDHQVATQILDSTPSGDACVNDCTVHPLVPELPFGGVGNSGMGKYHGRYGIEAFSNARGVLFHSAKIDPSFKYPPYVGHKLLRNLETKLL